MFWAPLLPSGRKKKKKRMQGRPRRHLAKVARRIPRAYSTDMEESFDQCIAIDRVWVHQRELCVNERSPEDSPSRGGALAQLSLHLRCHGDCGPLLDVVISPLSHSVRPQLGQRTVWGDSSRWSLPGADLQPQCKLVCQLERPPERLLIFPTRDSTRTREHASRPGVQEQISCEWRERGRQNRAATPSSDLRAHHA